MRKQDEENLENAEISGMCEQVLLIKINTILPILKKKYNKWKKCPALGENYKKK